MFFTIDFEKSVFSDGDTRLKVLFYEEQLVVGTQDDVPSFVGTQSWEYTLKLVDQTTVNQQGYIIEACMFENCPLYLMYYYHEVIMAGIAEEFMYDGKPVSLITISDSDKLLFPSLKPYAYVLYWEDEFGFAFSRVVIATDWEQALETRLAYEQYNSDEFASELEVEE